DRMLDIGFLPDLQRILSYLPKQRTTLLFSATFSPEIKRLANSYLQDPVTIEVARSNATASTVEQHFYRVDDDDKRAVLKQILRDRGLKQAFVFVNSKLGCARLARSLEREGLVTTALHGDKSQDERLKALDAFKTGAVDLLVCTDVAARGLDIKDVPAVFNFDIPFNAEDYVHRIGRTGRAGASGLAVSFVSARDTRLMGDLEKLLGKKLELEALELEADRRPAGHFNDGQRAWQQGEGPERGGREARAPRTESPAARPARTPRPPADPLFDKPYEPSIAPDAQPPSWEQSQRQAARTVSPNIKSRKKVPALFKRAEVQAAPPAPEVAEDTQQQPAIEHNER
ncbi:MAG: helicase-related protein, partial [Hydrogenophaga sp.]|nr:helicase-related protein [Hydrogenophaga sp.]